MATPAADPKLAPLADELKEFALTLERGVFPKGFFCALCDQLAFDSYKLLCCNKVICTTCHSKLEFPTTCPSCDHSPVEADSCPPNKALRNTMRVWLQKQKKKEETKAAEAKAASEAAATPAVEPTPAPTEAQASAQAAENPVESIEEATRTEDGTTDASAAEQAAQGDAGSAAPQHDEGSATAPDEPQQEGGQDAKDAEDENKSADSGQDQDNAQNANGPNGQMFPTGGMMNANGMPNQMGFGFNGQGNFGMGMNMPNMMNPGWNNMGMTPNPPRNRAHFNRRSGYGMNNMNGMNGMFGFGGNMGMGMNDMSMNYGGNFGNGWNGMGGGGGYGYNGYNHAAGYNQSGAYSEMMNQYPKNNMNRFQGNGMGNFPQQQNRSGSFGGGHAGAGMQHNSRPGSQAGPNKVRRFPHPRLPKTPKASHSPLIESQRSNAADNPVLRQSEGGSRAGTADPTEVKDVQASASSEPGQEGKAETAAAEGDSTAYQATAEGTSGEAQDVKDTNSAGPEAEQSSGLNQIQTVESVEMDDQGFDPSMMGGNMQYPPQMMNSFNSNQMNYNHHMGNMGYNNNFGPRGGFNNAYGAATVLTGEPRGVGVAGAPTGPRAMREGRPNTGFSSRANNVRFNPAPSATPAAEAPAGSRSPPRRARSDESLRVKDRSPSRSRGGSQARAAAQDDVRDRSHSPRDDRREDRIGSRTPQAGHDDDEVDLRKEKRKHRSSRYDDYDERDDRDDYDSRGSRGDRTRSASADSKYRSRRDKDKSRSSRSHRDRSREHKRRPRSRSRSLIVGDDEEYVKDESSSRRKDRSDRDKYRERSRDRDRKDRKERDYERDHDDEKYRSRDKDKEKRRRRDREVDEDERDYVEEKYQSSRRSRKDRDRDRDRDYEKEPPTRAVSPPVNAPTGPSADNFSIRGASRPKTAKPMAPPQPPTGPRAFMPPKGPAADRDRDRRHSRKGSISSSVPTTPTEAAPQDHYAAEREKNARARDMLERNAPPDRSERPEARSLHSRISSHSHHSSSRPSLSSKRSRDDYDDEERDRDARSGVPTGPASHSSKRRKSGDTGGTDLASVLAKGLRKKAGAPRRGGVKTEGEAERDAERVERERDGRRW
ncbi:uncharacterized protein CC84DRAFT_1206033 [Paraphaeosphaeria sporulosa]|uniref:RING-type domain-containing protein n=1 Tax=Paraphaeosphaeria sporulosa TaxID=1460663 RepID=A0A177C9J1_9PLEO|nr:uncharacterized protein CC84DRAFT_1206033 [Paraphaeosphaeria sporulosa]OAG04313.1 hypothetical protein CC84DRAFT_1206033 [Paraphaeosphaeria sporulosa]